MSGLHGSRAVSTDILHFRARVLGVCGQGLFHGQLLTPETVSAVSSTTVGADLKEQQFRRFERLQPIRGDAVKTL
jgi:hypothetical protein